MIGRIVDGRGVLEDGAAWLREKEPRFGAVLDRVGPLPLRRRPEGFAALLWVIVGQQVSTASAAALWARIEAAGLHEAELLARASDEALKAAGLSRPKIRYARALATTDLNYAALRGLGDEDVIATLTALPGIGRWTAEIYALSSLGRADVFPAGDLALQEAARGLFGLEARPTERDLRQMAADWAPWRAVAARALWAYYRVLNNKEGLGP